MEPQNISSAYDRVKLDHAQQTEQMLILKSSLPFLTDPKNLENVKEVVDFFKRRVMAHFEWEEREVFPVALAAGDLELKQTVRQMQIEHIQMIGSFDVLADMIAHHGFHFEKEELKKKFVTAASDIIEMMLPHARMEDARLYAFLRAQGVPMKPIF